MFFFVPLLDFEDIVQYFDRQIFFFFNIYIYIQYNECNALFQYIQHNYMTCPLHIVKNSTLNTPLSSHYLCAPNGQQHYYIKLHNAWRSFKPDVHVNNACYFRSIRHKVQVLA